MEIVEAEKRRRLDFEGLAGLDGSFGSRGEDYGLRRFYFCFFFFVFFCLGWGLQVVRTVGFVFNYIKDRVERGIWRLAMLCIRTEVFPWIQLADMEACDRASACNLDLLKSIFFAHESRA